MNNIYKHIAIFHTDLSILAFINQKKELWELECVNKNVEANMLLLLSQFLNKPLPLLGHVYENNEHVTRAIEVLLKDELYPDAIIEKLNQAGFMAHKISAEHKSLLLKLNDPKIDAKKRAELVPELLATSTENIAQLEKFISEYKKTL